VIDLAGQHAATTMPVMVSGRPAQATTLGHYLGGLAAPLGRAASRLQLEFEALNRSPLGVVAMAGTSLPIERERTAELLGFDGPVDNTFDAVVSVDHIVAVSQVAAAIVHPVRRFIGELGEWIRTNPTSFPLADSWTIPEPGLPQFVNPIGLERISASADTVAASATACDRAAAALGYEPPGQALDAIARAAIIAVRTATLVVDQLNDLLATGLEINRAYLANVAGKGHTTTSDLSIFLMETEGLDPVSAANIASMTVNRAIADGIEASGINTQMIDASALMVIGRELAVEFEAISRYLAPRRFLERRTSSGTPSPARTREYLGREEELLTCHVEWIAALERRINSADRERERLVNEALANVD
jgi:argininosuccinate lyase